MYIIFLIKGKEYILNKTDQVFYIDYQKNAKLGELVSADKILFCNGEFKRSFLANIKLYFEVEGENKEKTDICHYKPKKRYKKRKGAISKFTRVRIQKIEGLK